MLQKLITSATVAVVAGLAASALAGTDKGPTVTIGGLLDTQFGSQHQKRVFNTNANGQITHYGIVNDTQVHFKIDGHSHGLKYGGLINLNADTSTSKVGEDSVAHQTMVYVESALGRMEAGSYTGAYDAMRVSGATLAKATGGIDGDWKYWINTNFTIPDNDPTTPDDRFISPSPSLPTAMDKSYRANAAKVTVYTPSVAGFKAGVTFIPDTDHFGTVSHLKGTSRSFTTDVGANFMNGEGFRNVVQGGFGYNGKLDKVIVKASILGEIGSAKKVSPAANTTTNSYIYSRQKLRAYEAGASVHFMGFGLGGSYGSTGKSGAVTNQTHTTVANNTPTVNNTVYGTKAGRYYTGGVNYEHSKFGASFGYMNNRGPRSIVSGVPAAKDTTRLYSLGLDFKAAPGFMPYVEGTYFKSNVSGSATQRNNGNVILAGMKLNF